MVLAAFAHAVQELDLRVMPGQPRRRFARRGVLALKPRSQRTILYNNDKRSVTASKKSTVTIAPNDHWLVALQQTVVSTLHQVYPLEA